MPTFEIEERVARLEGRIDEHSKFFESISVKLTLMDDKGDRDREELEKRIDRNREELEKKIDTARRDLEQKMERLDRKMDTNFRWIVGIQITTWITVLLAILFK
ncbi:MAG: hypothetical protein AB1478_02475 [Nitrospirota bacterium]